MRAPPLVLLMALARQVTHFLVHHQVHQLQPGLPQQVSYSLLQQTDDVGHRKDHLHVGILFGGEPAELLHGSLLFDLISFLHSDSLLFSWQKNNRRPIMAASLRVAYFLRIYGQSPDPRRPSDRAHSDTASFPYETPTLELLRAGPADTEQRRIPVHRGTTAACAETTGAARPQRQP